MLEMKMSNLVHWVVRFMGLNCLLMIVTEKAQSIQSIVPCAFMIIVWVLNEYSLLKKKKKKK